MRGPRQGDALAFAANRQLRGRTLRDQQRCRCSRRVLRCQFARFGASTRSTEEERMGTIATTDGTEIFYKDWGSGQPIVFSHGWPLSGDDWDTQMLFFLQRGYRVIAHDRRGHGRSTQTSDGHDMDHYADDLAALTTHL